MTQPITPRPLARLARLTSVGSLATLVAMALLAGALTPGYSHVSQLISELGAQGAPWAGPFRVVGFGGAGVLLLGFCICAWRSAPRSRGTGLALVGVALYAAGYVAAAFFPCDAGCRPAQPSTSQLIHNAAGAIGYLLAPAFLFMLAREARGWPGGKALVVPGYAAAALALIGLLTLSPSSPAAGLSQRLIELAVLGWCALWGSHLARSATSAG